MREFAEWASATPFPPKPWLILGKGPTFSQRDQFDLDEYNLISLNHAVLEQPVDVAHVVDVDVIEQCGDALAENCRWLLMPRHPHVAMRASAALLEEFVPHVPTLQRLDDDGRLVWYNARTGRPEGRSPIIDLHNFSSEAALGIAARLGARTVRSLGVDGGRSYSPAFATVAAATLLANGQPDFNSQFAELDRIAAELRVDYRPLVAPHRVFVGVDETQMIAARVLEHSLQRHATRPLRVDFLDAPLTRLPRSRENRPRTPFSFNRFRIPELMAHEGLALYLDSDMLVFADVGEVFDLPVDGHALLCTRQDEPPEKWRDLPEFHPGRQFSVMLLDCARARWRLDDILDALDAGRLTYEALMFDLAVVDPQAIGEGIPVTWNHLERYEEGSTKLLHYTVVPTQPWRNDENPLRGLWEDAYWAAVADGAISNEEVVAAARRGWVKRSLADDRWFEDPPLRRRRTPGEVELDALRDEVDRLRRALDDVSPERRRARRVELLRRVLRAARAPRATVTALRSSTLRPRRP
jgi:hypothetical protein